MKEKQALAILSEDSVVNKIYTIRDQKVMLDSDLAALYGVETKRLNEQIRRNLDRFPEDFMFQLTGTEWDSLRSQFATSKNKRGGRTYLPNVFTEHGVLMLSSILSSQQAIQVNIQVVRIFTRLRKLLGEHNELKSEMTDVKRRLTNHDKNIEVIFSYIDELTPKTLGPRKRIGYLSDNL